jgi:hypothetical protein
MAGEAGMQVGEIFGVLRLVQALAGNPFHSRCHRTSSSRSCVFICFDEDDRICSNGQILEKPVHCDRRQKLSVLLYDK